MKGREAYIVARNSIRILLDSTRLDDILEVGALTGQAAMERATALVMESQEGRDLLAQRPELNSEAIDFEWLRSLPVNTVGRLFVSHMDRYELDINALNQPTPSTSDTDVVYILRRYRGNHDIWHTMLGLGTEGYEEVLVHSFTYGQLRFPLSSLIVFFGTLKHIVLEGRWEVLKRQLNAAYEIGRSASPLVGVYWERHWHRPVQEVREELGLKSLTDVR